MKQGTKGFRILLALVLALAMVMGSVLPVMAETVERPVDVTNGKIDLETELYPVTGDAEEGLDAGRRCEGT